MPSVLLVNTEAHLHGLLKRKLEQDGFEVCVLGAGLPIDECHPDLIVTGQPDDTPGTAGDVPVIFISPRAADASLARAGHLKMPFRPSQLVAMARAATRSSL